MNRETVFRAIALGGALALMAGCATRTQSVQSICEAAGGTYAQDTCQPGTSRSAQQICDREEARWIPTLGVCEFSGRGGNL
jgi:hypothetical protein